MRGRKQNAEHQTHKKAKVTMAEKRSTITTHDGVGRPGALDIESSNSELLANQSTESEKLLADNDERTTDDESKPVGAISPGSKSVPSPAPSSTVVTKMGLQVLVLLAVQNCSKNLLMRYVMKDQPNFLTSAAVIGVEAIKLVLCTLYILLVDKRPLSTIVTFMREDWRNSLLLGVPAAAYSLQMSLEYVALANLNAAMFSVLVQCKLLFTATFAAIVLRKKLKYVQVLSLVLLTTGVMLCNLQKVIKLNQGIDDEEDGNEGNATKGIVATLGIAVSSGFASVYTEKVIKAQRNKNVARENYSLAYMQVQLALVSLVIIGCYALVMDFQAIVEKGLWHNFTHGAFFSVCNSAIGGLIVAAVLKFADSVLKGYATAISVVLTGVLSMFLFGTNLSAMYFLGIVNVVVAVLLYNGRKETLEKYVC